VNGKREPWKPRPATKAGQSSRVAMEVKASHGAMEIRRFTVEKARAFGCNRGG
jgi:hypothetical protein